MKKNRKYYERLFKPYPDLVTVLQFREMLGGVGDCFARRLIRQGQVRHFYIQPNYLIPKSSIIDYVLSEDYTGRRLKVKV